MIAAWVSWLLVFFLTLANLRMFSVRWAEPGPRLLPELVGDDTLNALALGVGIGVTCVALLRSVQARRFTSAVLLGGLSIAWFFALSQLEAFETFFTVNPFVVLGGVAALLCFSRSECVADSPSQTGLINSFGIFVALIFNALLLFAPMSSHLPSYVQDNLAYEHTFREFYFGSVHSDISPVSMALRRLINLFYDHPSINATALSSIMYISLGLSFVALSVERLVGRIWAFMFLAIALTDKWIVVSALSSALLGQPLLSGGVILYLCVWAAMRPRSALSQAGATVLGVVLAFGLVFILYSYSAARMTWLIGIGILFIILVFRRALPVNLCGGLRMVTCAVPSIMAVLFIWGAVFRGDTERFVSQLLISPPPDYRIASLSSYPEKLTVVHDPDVPIWWGTARLEMANKSLYWRRSPGEIYEKARWFLQRMGAGFLPPMGLVLLGGLGLVVGLLSRNREFSLLAGVTLILEVSAFATYVIGQDYAAYRRAISCELFLCVGVVLLFASLCERQARSVLPLLLCGTFVLLKTPSQANALLGVNLFAYTCPICQPNLDIRHLVNSTLFDSIRDREMRIVVEEGGVSSFYSGCANNAFASYEFRRAAPRSTLLPLNGQRLEQLLPTLTKGSLLILSCAPAGSSEMEASRDPDIRAICEGQSRFGPMVGVVAGSVYGNTFWWSVSEVR